MWGLLSLAGKIWVHFSVKPYIHPGKEREKKKKKLKSFKKWCFLPCKFISYNMYNVDYIVLGCTEKKKTSKLKIFPWRKISSKKTREADILGH